MPVCHIVALRIRVGFLAGVYKEVRFHMRLGDVQFIRRSVKALCSRALAVLQKAWLQLHQGFRVYKV